MSKKRRMKKYCAASTAQRHLMASLHEVWFCDGHCLTTTEAGGVYNTEHALWVLHRKQQWTAMHLVFCETESEYYVKHDLVPYPGHQRRADLNQQVGNDLFALTQAQNQRHVISAGVVMVPSHDVDLLAHKSAFVDRFERWGAFDPQLCDMATLIKDESRENVA